MRCGTIYAMAAMAMSGILEVNSTTVCATNNTGWLPDLKFGGWMFTRNTIFLKLKIHPAAHSRWVLTAYSHNWDTVGMLAHKYFHQWAIFKYPKIVYSSQYQCQNWGSLLTISLIITMQCMLDSECLEQYPEDGPCIGSDADALVSVKTMEEIEGGWRLYIL